MKSSKSQVNWINLNNSFVSKLEQNVLVKKNIRAAENKSHQRRLFTANHWFEDKLFEFHFLWRRSSRSRQINRYLMNYTTNNSFLSQKIMFDLAWCRPVFRMCSIFVSTMLIFCFDCARPFFWLCSTCISTFSTKKGICFDSARRLFQLSRFSRLSCFTVDFFYDDASFEKKKT